MRRLRSLLAPLIWRARAGQTLTQEQLDDRPRGISITCLHPPGSWSYCTGGWRYCLRCMRVRVRC